MLQRDSTVEVGKKIEFVKDIKDISEIVLVGKEKKLKERTLEATELYLKEIGHKSLLTAEEEVHYSRLALQGCEASRQRMIECNLRLVVKIARRYLNRGLSLLDLIEEGNLGLIHSVEKFDPERGFRFSTYSTWWIRQCIERALMNQTRTVRLPIHIVKEINSYLRVARELMQECEGEPSIEAIAKRANKPVETVQKLLSLKENVTSLDSSLSGDSEKSVVENFGDNGQYDPVNQMYHENFETELEQWLDLLTDKHRDVIIRRFGLRGHDPATLEEVGKAIGLTRERVRQIQVEGLKIVREHLESKGIYLETFYR